MGKIAQAQEQVQAIQTKQNTNKDIVLNNLKNNWQRISKAIPAGISEERFFQLIVSELNQNTALQECSPSSLLSSIMRCATLGLEPSSADGLGRAYIVPYNKKATLIIGYKGMLELIRRSGQISSISVNAVYDGDVFEYEYGLEEKLRHIPAPDVFHTESEEPDYVYLIAKFINGGHYFNVLSKAEIRATKEAATKGRRNTPWSEHYLSMAKKTIIRRSFPYLPIGTQAQSALIAEGTTGGFEDALSKNTDDDLYISYEYEPEINAE